MSSTTRRRLRNLSWILGTLSVSASIAQFGFVSHRPNFSPEEILAFQRASQLAMFNGVGLCLLTRKKKTLLIALPFACLSLATTMALGSVVFDLKYAGTDRSLMSLTRYTQYLTALGWAGMIVC
ncbi:hypothetical protein FGO68_gene14952 [Halteria grandinella]|uniref:Uncharacterized protein n=1 Tax=Halteria grandinella TaxID=5974 RepID=A0A8J8NBJ2_HALGN|nr:hypothetical protein FGO68_gene14952 [Halteria grandinella]